MELTLEELADQLVSLMPQYVKDYVFINDFLDEPSDLFGLWADVTLPRTGSFAVEWGFGSDGWDSFSPSLTIRGSIELAIKEIKRAHGIAEEGRRELYDEEAEC